jgi:hypothetical protein
VIVNLDFSPYEQTIAKLRDDLLYIQKFKSPFAPANELNHIEYILQKLEDEITAFREMLPRLDSRRAVLSAVGSVLKWFFGTATLLDVEELHKTIDTMHRTEGDIIHSVDHQMTYLKTLDSAVKFNTEAVETLSEKVKAIMLDSNKWKEETDIALHWLNYTMYNQSNIFTYVRQLEFAILELRTMVKEVLISLDSTMAGKLSMNLIPPVMLRNILKNVTSYFPDGYTLCVSLQRNTINLFYEFIDMSVLADRYSVKLVMLIPLKTFERHFYLYKLITFPYKISNLGNYIQLTAEYDNLVLDDSNQRFLLWKEADIKKCRGKGIVICPADTPIYGRNVLTCESSLYFQRNEARTLCSRRILQQNFAPILIRHSRDWIYSFGSKQQVNLKCRQNSTWITSTWSLQGNGILHNASACHVTGQNFQLYPATEGHALSTVTYQADVRVQHIEPVTYQEVQILQDRSPPDVTKLENIAATSELFKHRDLDATLVVHATERKNDERYHFYWYFTIPTLVAIILTIMVCNGYPYVLRNFLHKIRCTTQPVVSSTPEKNSQSSPEASPEASPEEQPSTSQLQSNGSGRNSEFVTYSVQTAA